MSKETKKHKITNYSPTEADTNNEYRHLNNVNNKDYYRASIKPVTHTLLFMYK
jgi:hypothetical protein